MTPVGDTQNVHPKQVKDRSTWNSSATRADQSDCRAVDVHVTTGLIMIDQHCLLSDQTQ